MIKYGASPLGDDDIDASVIEYKSRIDFLQRL